MCISAPGPFLPNLTALDKVAVYYRNIVVNTQRRDRDYNVEREKLLGSLRLIDKLGTFRDADGLVTRHALALSCVIV